MKVLKIKALRGPNQWSIKKSQLIEMLLDLEHLEYQPTNKIPGFRERLECLIPSLYTHQCSEGHPGGFFSRVADGTWMGHVIEHIAIELQNLSGMEVAFGRTRSTSDTGVYHVVFSYTVEEAGVYAGKAAVRIAEALIAGVPYNIDEDILELKSLREAKGLGPSTQSVVDEAQKRGIPVVRIDDGAFVQFGYGKEQKRIEATITSETSFIGVDVAGNKDRTKKLLTEAFVPVPDGVVASNVEELENAVALVGFPIVVKPLDGNQGKGATTNIQSMGCALEAFRRAQIISPKVVVERFIQGNDFRALVVNYKLVAVAKRTPAAVVGDGTATIRELVEEVNKDPRRGNGHCKVLSKIKLDEASLELLQRDNLTPDSILPKGKVQWLKSTANLSTGGTAEDVTDSIHPANRTLFERIARVVDLDICGIDVMAPELETPITENGGAIIEVNAAPGLRMHLEPSSGTPRNVAEPIVDMLFPEGKNGRIPIIAITGTNGKTTTTRLVSQMASNEGFYTGFTTTDGIYLNNELVYKGDCSGPASAQMVLKDPAVNFAVLETARGGILRSGIGFDQCSCAIVTNIASDHLGIDYINDLEQLAHIKSVVPETVMPEGWVVLNSDDDRVYAMKDRVKANVALFSLFPDSIRIQRHCAEGGRAAYLEEGILIIREGNLLKPLEEVKNIPITFGGKAKFNIYNVLGAALGAYCSGISFNAINGVLRQFKHSAESTPGRLNEYKFDDFTVMVDYAHNAHGLKALGELVTALPAAKRVGVIAGIGDRRNEDIIELAEQAANIFDEIVIRQDEDLRGRTEIEISSLLRSGIQKVSNRKKVTYFSNEHEAIDFAVQSALPGSLTVIFVDNVQAVCQRVQHHWELYQKQKQGLRATG